jgi:hypothetical protein
VCAEAATTGKEPALSIPCNRGASRGDDDDSFEVD